MLVEPGQDVGMLVGGIIVDDDMDGFLLGHPGLDDVQEADELLMAVALHALADDLALEDIESREQRGRAMTLVIMGHGAGASRLHRQARLGAIKGLDLALLIDRQDNGVVGRVDIEADDVMQLGRELRVVRQLELPDPVRLEAMGTPDPLHRADADPDRLRHRRAGPVAGRGWRACQRQSNHAFGHLGTQRRDARGPRLVAPQPRDPSLLEALLPAPDHGLALPVASMISAVPRPAAVRRTILARQTCFCGLLRSATTASSSLRAAALNRISVRLCIPKTRTRESEGESQSESKCQICSTSASSRRPATPSAP